MELPRSEEGVWGQCPQQGFGDGVPKRCFMIHVICPNPAIDKLYAIDDFAPGEDYPGQRPLVRFGG